MLKRASASIAVLFFVACASLDLQEVQQSDTLMFGTNRTNGAVVSDAEWRAFVDEVIVPRFPGFTEWNAEGHWKSEREATHVVMITHLHRGAQDQLVREIIDAYKSRFQQEAVFWVRSEVMAEAR
jgi:hypothetical protein